MSVSFKPTVEDVAETNFYEEVPETDFGPEIITRNSRQAEPQEYIFDQKKRVYRNASLESYHSDSKSSRRSNSTKEKSSYTLTATEAAVKVKKMKDGPSSISTVLIMLGLIFSGFMLTVSGIIILTTEFDMRFTLCAWIFIISGLLMIFGSLLGEMKNVKKLLSKKYWQEISNFKGREPTTIFDWG